MIIRKRTCPECGRIYTQHPALSRKDNKTEICPDCGVDEALDAMLRSDASTSEQKHVRADIHRIMKEAGAGNG